MLKSSTSSATEIVCTHGQGQGQNAELCTILRTMPQHFGTSRLLVRPAGAHVLGRVSRWKVGQVMTSHQDVDFKINCGFSAPSPAAFCWVAETNVGIRRAWLKWDIRTFYM